MKGTGEAHPTLSPNDEFAGFEIWDKASFGPTLHTAEMLPREYAREAYKRGLVYEAKLGANPFKFGLIGSTDSHTGLSTTEENNFFGKVSVLEPSADPVRFDEVIAGRTAPKGQQLYARMTAAAGLAASGRARTLAKPFGMRSRARKFSPPPARASGFASSADSISKKLISIAPTSPRYGYANGVPMGGDLKSAPGGKAPAFLVRAIRDPDGANLDRVQIIKGWLDANGKTQEKIYDLAVSDGRKIGRDGRCKTRCGQHRQREGSDLQQLDRRADSWKRSGKIRTSTRSNAPSIMYACLEIPTPRWTTFDAKVFGVKLPTDVPSSTQERAFTSPIWYTP